MSHVIAAVGLGTSLGACEILALAARALDRLPGTRVRSTSRIFRSPAAGGVATGTFHNAVLTVDTDRDPDALLSALKALEGRLGRRPTRAWADRRIDLDLLVYGLRIIVGRSLVLPHPRIATRSFVLAPLRDAWPAAVDPWTGGRYAAIPRDLLPVVGVLPRPRPGT